MRKTVITILMALAAVSGYAQTAYSALMLSENDYVGTARTAAMGNAFTALGGDLGAVSINPAASAVIKYSQIFVTPGLNIYASTASGVSPYENGELNYFERTLKSSRTKFNMPSSGISLYYETGRHIGIKSITGSFVVNQTASYNQNVYAAGTNDDTSFMGQMAYEASMNKYTSAELANKDAFNLMPVNAWKAIIGYNTGMIDPYNDFFVGATEKAYNDGTAFMAGTVDQAYGRNISGSKYEYILNAGMNISDFLYIGANLTLHSADYSYSEYFKESAIDRREFEITYADEEGNIIPTYTKYFNRMKYIYSYSYAAVGYSAKLGVIVTPYKGLRIGAAIQTPTIMSVDEAWEESGEAEFDGNGGGSYSSRSPLGENTWSFRTPLQANFGIAYTFSKRGLVSADYELSNYSNLRYTDSRYTDPSDLDLVNQEMKDAYGFAHKLRIGAEFKAIPELALRAGYNLNVSAANETLTHKAALGLGYSSRGSFYADVACTRAFLPREYFMPYADYVYKLNKEDLIVDPNYYAPEILIRSSLWNVILTIGFRF